MPSMSASTELEKAVDLVRLRQMISTRRAEQIRLGAGLDRGEMAAAIGVARNTLWRWEHGEQVPRGDIAHRYLAVLDRLEALQLTGIGSTPL